MARTVREIIHDISVNHVRKNNGLIFGQNLTAVGFVGGTVPNLNEEQGVIELPNSDCSNVGVVVGAALMGKKPMYVVRYQGFQWYNATTILNYACKSKEMWNKPCPIFIRSIAMENGIGPVAGSSHASLFYRMPGIKIFSPMTPSEYQLVYDLFLKDNSVYYVSEHRGSYNNSMELEDIELEKSDITLLPISITRFAAEEARKKLDDLGIKVSILHQFKLKPFKLALEEQETINNSKFGGIVIDDDYENGLAKCLAYDIMLETNKPIYTMGLKERTAGFHKSVDLLPPSCDDIVEKVLKICKK